MGRETSSHRGPQYALGVPLGGATRSGGASARAASVVCVISLCVFSREVHAQLRADPESMAPEAVTAEVPLEPGPGRVAVDVHVSRTPTARVGFDALVRPRAEPGASFTREPHPHHCNAPCTGYLRPGVHRLYVDAGTEFAWSVDVTVAPDLERLRVRLRGHLFAASFAAGPLVIVGTVATLAGPAAIIVGAATGDHTVPATLWGTGIGLFAGGAAALGLGAWLFRSSVPAVEAIEPVRGARVSAARPTVVPTLGGVWLTHRF